MVHYDPPSLNAAQQPPPVCPKCGSHRTEIVGITDQGQVVVRCNTCGERSVVPSGSPRTAPTLDVDPISAELDAMRVVAAAIARLDDPESRRRVLRWIGERFDASQPGAQPPDAAHAHAPAVQGHSEPADAALSIDGVDLMFEAEREGVRIEGAEPRSIQAMVSGFIADFQRLAIEWQDT